MTSTVKDFKNRVDAITEIASFPFADTKFLINIIILADSWKVQPVPHS